MNNSKPRNAANASRDSDPSSRFDSNQGPRFATEDDFFDDCPLCRMMREDVRNGAKIEIFELDLDLEDIDD